MEALNEELKKNRRAYFKIAGNHLDIRSVKGELSKALSKGKDLVDLKKRVCFHDFSRIPHAGLGLHIVAKYVEMMDGKIEIKSELNKGTEINLIFAQ